LGGEAGGGTNCYRVGPVAARGWIKKGEKMRQRGEYLGDTAGSNIGCGRRARVMCALSPLFLL
jgi:hypothetical protein